MNHTVIIESDTMQVLKEETRNGILECAEKLFAQNGYDCTTMDEIAKKASVSKGNIYLYFKDKKELFASIIPAEIATSVSNLIMQRVEAVVNHHDDKSAHNSAGVELIHFLILNRLKFLIMLNPFNSNIIGPLRQKIVQNSCNAYENFYLAKKACSSDGIDTSLLYAMVSILYENLLTMIGHILSRERSNNEYAFLLKNLFLYHYKGIISIPESLSKE